MASFLATCLAGCEKEVVDDISKILCEFQSEPFDIEIVKPPVYSEGNAVKIGNHHVFRGESGCGKLLLRNIHNTEFIHKVRSVQYWFVYLSACNSASKSSDTQSLLSAVLCNTNFDIAFDWWVSSLTDSDKTKYADIVSKARRPKFCVRCIRDGAHKFTSIELAQQLGGAIMSKTLWEVDLSTMDFEIIALVLNEQMLIGIHIPTKHSVPFLKSRLPSEIRHPCLPSKLSPSLRPSTAYNLMQLAHPRPNEVVIDCMCGSGSGFIEAAYSFDCVAVGGDVDTDLQSTLTETMQLTASMSQNKAIAEAVYWSAHKLPLRTGSVDIALLDLPFGKIAKKIPKMYRAHVPKYLEEITRVLVPCTGRCVLLAQTHQQLVACLDSIYFTGINTRGVNIGGYVCAVVTAQRSDVAFRVPSKGSDTWDDSKNTNASLGDSLSIGDSGGNGESVVGQKRSLKQLLCESYT